MERGTENQFKAISTFLSDDKKRAASIWEVTDQRGQKGFRLFMEEISQEDGKDIVKTEDFYENSIYYVEDAAENYVMYIKN